MRNETIGRCRRNVPLRAHVPGEQVPPYPFEQSLTLGERLADKVASFGGSWTFIFCFAGVLVCWVLLNSEVLAHWHRQFDPYPYILLNLFLSMLAALQAPVILMSQNRQAATDRVHARHDYEVNLRAEFEISKLHEKLDRLHAERLHAALERLEQRIAGGLGAASELRSDGAGDDVHGQGDNANIEEERH